MNIDTIIDSFFQKLQKIDGVKIVYRRGELSAELTALRDAVNVDNLTSERFAVNRQTMVFAFARDEMKWSDDSALIPAIGDRIEYDGSVYEVVINDRKKAWDVEEVGERILSVLTQKI